MLHQTTFLMHTSQKISCVNGPWWFVQMWLQLYMHQIVGIDLNNWRFPSSNYKEGEFKSPKNVKLMEKLPQPYLLIRISVNSLSFSSEVSPIPFGFLIWTMIPSL
jgi:hypothetical protein